MTDKKLPPELARLVSTFQSADGSSAAEGLLLIKAFVSIEDPSLRATIVELVVKIAAANASKR